MPDSFKTPGAKVNVNTGPQNIFGPSMIVDAKAVQELMAMRQRSLQRIQEKKAQAAAVRPLRLDNERDVKTCRNALFCISSKRQCISGIWRRKFAACSCRCCDLAPKRSVTPGHSAVIA
jgi:hypothetical protein